MLEGYYAGRVDAGWIHFTEQTKVEKLWVDSPTRVDQRQPFSCK